MKRIQLPIPVALNLNLETMTMRFKINHSDDVRDTAIHTVTVLENSGRLIGTASVHRRLSDGETLASITPE